MPGLVVMECVEAGCLGQTEDGLDCMYLYETKTADHTFEGLDFVERTPLEVLRRTVLMSG